MRVLVAIAMMMVSQTVGANARTLDEAVKGAQRSWVLFQCSQLALSFDQEEAKRLYIEGHKEGIAYLGNGLRAVVDERVPGQFRVGNPFGSSDDEFILGFVWASAHDAIKAVYDYPLDEWSIKARERYTGMNCGVI